MNFNKWIQFHSNKEFADKYRIFRLNEDEEICFFIQYASRALMIYLMQMQHHQSSQQNQGL